MEFFRIKIGQDNSPVVEPFLSWQRLDGTSYIPVGGSSMSYLTVAPEFEATERVGRIQLGDIRPNSRGGLELFPQGEVRANEAGVDSFIPANAAADPRAFVVVPSGAYDFDIPHGMSPITPRDHLAARSIVLYPGDVIKALSKVRTIREWEGVKPMYLSYQGHGRLTFSTDEPATAQSAVEETAVA